MNSCNHHKNCREEAFDAAESLCHEKNVNFTALRRDVFSIIWESHSPSKAYDILEKLKETKHKIQPPTIYRALDFLLENGLIHRLNSLKAYIGCGHPNIHDTCYFLFCHDCQKITECCDETLRQAIKGISLQNNFKVENLTLEISGRCSDCL